MFLAAQYDPNSVLAAGCLTFAVVIGLTIYAHKTTDDFTTCGGAFVGCGITIVFFTIAIALDTSNYKNMIIVFIIIIIFSFYIVYDAQLIAGGRYEELSYDDYVIGALMLFIDVIGLFIYILALTGKR